MKSYKHDHCVDWEKWSFWPFRILRRCLDLCTVIFVLTNFYRAILSTRNRGVSGSGMGLKKAHPPPPPVFSQVPSQLLHPYPWTPNLVCLPQQDLGASSPTYVDAPGKEPALQGLKSGLFHPEGSTDSFEAISPLYKSLLVLRITEQIHCNGSIGTWPVGSPWL